MTDVAKLAKRLLALWPGDRVQVDGDKWGEVTRYPRARNSRIDVIYEDGQEGKISRDRICEFCCSPRTDDAG